MPKLYNPAKNAVFCFCLMLISTAATAQLKAGFSASSWSGCSPLKVNFTNNTTGGTTPYTWMWKLRNGNTSTVKDPSAIFILAKTYNVTLIVTDASGKMDSVTQTITVFANPIADLKADVRNGCPPVNTVFTDQSTSASGNISSWLWDFGDGSTSSAQNPPKHQYASPGIYSVSLYVIDKNGCSNAVIKKNYIEVFQPPVADFTVTPNGGCDAPLTVFFTPNITSIGAVSYLWDFGDGGTSNSDKPTHTYLKKGLYTVTLSITDGNGCSDSKTKANLIYIGKPKPDFTYNPGSGCDPLEVSFSNITSFGSKTGDKYYWDFGDKTSSTLSDPKHTYSAGRYTVRLAVTSPFGCTDTITRPDIIVVTPKFKISFTGDTVLCEKPYAGIYKNTSDIGAKVVSWTFSDKTKLQTGEKVSHFFPDSGGYFSVKLTVSKYECVETLTKDSWIFAKATVARIKGTNYQGCAPLTANFKNKSTTFDSIVSTKWDFGDSTTSTDWDGGDHLYKDTGFYTVKLTLITKHGCKLIDTLKVSVGTRPKADFKVYPDSGCLNMLRHVHFKNLTNPGNGVEADHFWWSFQYWPKAFHDSVENPVIRYSAPPGDYYVQLIASNKGCSDTITKYGIIHIRPPWAHFRATIDSCMRNRVTFYDSSIGATKMTYYFGDGGSSSQRTVTHVYTTPGKYVPFQVVSDSFNGCSDTAWFFADSLYIRPPWVDTVYAINQMSGCWPYLAKFVLINNDTSYNYINFGDGDSIVSSSPDSVTQHIYHFYKKKGVFKVHVRSVTKYGCIKYFDIYPVVINGPHVNFSVSPAKGCVPLTVSLIDSSDKDNSISSKYYYMGNGDSLRVTSGTMSYTYKTPPADQSKGFKITLKVSDQACTNSFNRIVYPFKPVADFYKFPAASCDSVNYEVIATNNGIGPFTYAWDFGDGFKSTALQCDHTFKVGKYNLKLKMTDVNGCTDSTVKVIDVPATHLKADFNINITQGSCPPFTAQFNDQSKFPLDDTHYWDWDFGDGSPHSHRQNPSKVYYTAGSFKVTLRIHDELGCKDSIVKNDIINIKGPKGDYDADKLSGCVPLTVSFKASSTNASKFIWDLGDGTLGYGNSVTHTYKEPRRYIPLLILSDSFGCSYTLPPKDTINAFPLPVPDFNYDSTCAGIPIPFRDNSNPVTGRIISWLWDFNDGTTSIQQNPTHLFKKNGYYPVNLKVINSQGCENTKVKNVRYGNIIAALSVPKNGCIGYPVHFTDRSRSDSAIKSWLWTFGDGGTSTLQNPVHTYFNKGIYSISLIVSNYKGCTDTLNPGAQILVGDTLPPPAPFLYRVTVADDHTVEVDFSRYNDIDFAKYVIYMRDNNTGNYLPLDSITDINQTSYFAKNLNTLRNVYCFKVQACNVCGYRSTLNTPYHCTIDLSVKPGINKAMLSWTPYQGWDVMKYKIYRQSVLDPPGLNVIDSVDGAETKYTDTLVVCYKPMIYRVRAYEKGGFRQFSWSDTAATMPIHVPNVPNTELIRATVQDNKNAFIEWQRQPRSQVKHWILERSVDGINYNIVDTPYLHDRFSVTDLKVDVQNNSYTYRVKILDSCDDEGPYSNIGKTILLKIDTTADVKPHLRWSSYQEWQKGVAWYDIYIKNTTGQFEWLARTGNGKDTDYIDNITDLNSLPEYTYHVVAHKTGTAPHRYLDSTIISMSNDARLKPKSRLYVPNAFSPDGNGTNDSFFVKGMYIREFHMKIFDRWGTKVFETGSMKEKWGGDYRKGQPIMDSYKYLIYYRGVDGDVKYLDGWVTVVE
jgi:gliding motility-associated-like protein